MVGGGSPRQLGDLLTLARARFGGLGQAEVNLLEAAPRGEVARCGPSDRLDDPANDPAQAETWGAEREIRAELVRWLAIDRDAAERTDPRGIQIHAAKVVGPLDLSFADVPFPLALYRCRLTDHANLIHARIPALNLMGTWTRSITADGVNVAGDVFLRIGFRAEGEVRLLGGQFGGQLNCSGVVGLKAEVRRVRQGQKFDSGDTVQVKTYRVGRLGDLSRETATVKTHNAQAR